MTAKPIPDAYRAATPYLRAANARARNASAGIVLKITVRTMSIE
jgi:hypothetical protein